jgi:diaminohydroxyphosphoribosylaminopyrimidine deaminase / 5-amino-6-(5-phosphoribosylamino)uracil reductase
MSTKLSRQNNHNHFMKLAFLQAKKVLGNTKENPPVGCVIVKEDQIISASHTSFNGRPHAERNALFLSNKKNKNSILYSTLEPCSHYGKTHPCTLAIKKNKIKKVFYAIDDPDQRTFCKSNSFFKKNNIIYKKNIRKPYALNFYKSYINSRNKNLPYVMAKIAVSKDFYTINKKKKWITNSYSRQRVHILRSIHDCLLTSSVTINKDNPDLTCRIKGLESTTPDCIIIDKKLSINISSKIVNNANKRKTIIFYNHIDHKKIRYLNKKKIKLIKLKLDQNGRFDLRELLFRIKLLGYSRVFLESGLNLTSNFLNHELITDFSLFISKNKLGSKGSNKFNFNKYLSKKNNFFKENVNLFGDKFLSFSVK